MFIYYRISFVPQSVFGSRAFIKGPRAGKKKLYGGGVKASKLNKREPELEPVTSSKNGNKAKSIRVAYMAIKNK